MALCWRIRPRISQPYTKLALLPVVLRSSYTASSDAPVLSRLQSDLKDALRAKNKPALNTIRSLQAAIINASKTDKPITTDASFYALINRQMKASRVAIEEFQNAKRDDLVSKEQDQLDVLEKYASEIPKVAESEVDELISGALAKLKDGERSFNSVMGRVMGGIKGRPHDASFLMSKIQEVTNK